MSDFIRGVRILARVAKRADPQMRRFILTTLAMGAVHDVLLVWVEAAEKVDGNFLRTFGRKIDQRDFKITQWVRAEGLVEEEQG